MNRTAGFLLLSLILAISSASAGTPPSIPDGAAPVVPPGTTVARIGNPGAAPPNSPASPPAALRDVGSGCIGSWQNAGGTPGRNGRSDELGPTTADLLWSGGRSSLIAWQPVTDGDRVFMVRQTQFGSAPEGSPVVAMDLATGAELWAVHIPYETGDWTTWIAAAHSGLVFASRAGNGSSVSAKMYALHQEDGSVAWASTDDVDAGSYDGVVLAPNGDLLVGNFTSLMRIKASDGTTAWSVPRTCSVSSSCGPATYGEAVYVADATGGGHVIVRHALATGAVQYTSPVMSGFTLQNTPYVGPDGTVYLARTQNNAATDYHYAFEDTGATLVERWHVPAAWTTFSEFAVAPDGSPYMLAPGYELLRLDLATGASTATAGAFPDCGAPHMATDGNGTFYLGNGGFSDGRLRIFGADLNPLWDTAVTNINIGGPAIGHGGALVVCGINTDVRVYRPEPSAPVCMPFADGFESGDTSSWSATVP